MAGGCDGLLERYHRTTDRLEGAVGARVREMEFADQLASGAPGLGVVQTVQGVASGNAAFAAGAAVEIDFEGILFSGAGRVQRNQVPVTSLRLVGGSAFVPLRELQRSRELSLLGQVGVDQCGKTGRHIKMRQLTSR